MMALKTAETEHKQFTVIMRTLCRTSHVKIRVYLPHTATHSAPTNMLNLNVALHCSLIVSLDRAWTPRQDGLVEGPATLHSSPKSYLLHSA